MKKNCPYCGSVNEDVLYCENCGRDVSHQFGVEAIQAKQEEKKRKEEEELRKKNEAKDAEEKLKNMKEEADASRRKAEEEKKRQQFKENKENLDEQEQKESLNPFVQGIWFNPQVQSAIGWVCIICPILGILLGTLMLNLSIPGSKLKGAGVIALASKCLLIHIAIDIVLFIIAILAGVVYFVTNC